MPIAYAPRRARRVPRDRGRIVLAYGEVTGHAHAITSRWAAMFEAADGVILRLRWRATLRHEEHAPIRVPAGVYRVIRQREYPDVLVED